MGRYNTVRNRPTRRPTSPIRTVSTPRYLSSYPEEAYPLPEYSVGLRTVRNYEGGAGYINDPRGELFRLGMNFLVNEKTFYEDSASRKNRFKQLVTQLAVSDPNWTLNFLIWLRNDGNIRSAPVLGAVYALHARLHDRETSRNRNQFANQGYNRKFIAQVPQRLDEIGEMFAIWEAEFGKPFPQPLKRGAGDALNRLANEYSVMKYDTASKNYRIADILSIAHINPANFKQEELYRWAIDSRFDNPERPYLPMISYNTGVRANARINPRILLDPVVLHNGGFTWEDVMSLVGNVLPKKDIWEALIFGGSMGYEALLKNLRNFEQAGISQEAVAKVCRILADPARVARSRQFPFRFWAALKNTNSYLWAQALETALTHSIVNIPELPGNSLILVDVSGSTDKPMSNNSTIKMNEAGALFGAAMALKNLARAELHIYGSNHMRINVRPGTSILRLVEQMVTLSDNVGKGTETIKAVRDLYQGQDRVFNFTDMQSYPRFDGWGNKEYPNATIDDVLPKETLFYAWDLRGYRFGDVPSGTGTRHQLGGLTDATFKIVPFIENADKAKWPWER